MNEFGAVLAAFREATGRNAAIWERYEGNIPPVQIASTSDTFSDSTHVAITHSDISQWAASHGLVAQAINTGDVTCWIFTEAGKSQETERFLNTLVTIVRRIVRERDGATRELAERYEEISLLYTISELLGSSASVDAVAGTLLRELAITVGAPRAAFLILDAPRRVLEQVGTLGIVGTPYPDVNVKHPTHIAARAFRGGQTLVDDAAAAALSEPVLCCTGDVLAAPITRANAGDDTIAGHWVSWYLADGLPTNRSLLATESL